MEAPSKITASQDVQFSQQEIAGPMYYLTDDCFFSLFAFLNISELAATACVSKQWNEQTRNEIIRCFNLNPNQPAAKELSYNRLHHFLQKNGTMIHCLNLGGRMDYGDQLLELISYCPNLTQLAVQSDKINDRTLSGISKISTLQKLFFLEPLEEEHYKKMRCKRFSDSALKNLAHLENILFVGVDEGICTQKSFIVDISGIFQSQVLDTYEFGQITDSSLEQLPKLVNLQMVDLSGCNYMTRLQLLNIIECIYQCQQNVVITCEILEATIKILESLEAQPHPNRNFPEAHAQFLIALESLRQTQLESFQNLLDAREASLKNGILEQLTRENKMELMDTFSAKVDCKILSTSFAIDPSSDLEQIIKELKQELEVQISYYEDALELKTKFTEMVFQMEDHRMAK